MTDDQAKTEQGPAVAGPVQRDVGRPVERIGARMWRLTQQMLCPHTHGRLMAIEWDGESVHECAACGKHVRRPL